MGVQGQRGENPGGVQGQGGEDPGGVGSLRGEDHGGPGSGLGGPLRTSRVRVFKDLYRTQGSRLTRTTQRIQNQEDHAADPGSGRG